MSILSLEAKSNFVQKIVDGDLDMENLDLSLIANVVQQDKKEKRQKRGPNKWMPMRRTVDPELQKRIRQAAGLNDEEKTPEGSSKKKAKKPTSTKKRKSPSAAKKRIQVQDDSSEDEEMDSQKDGASDSENSSTNQRKSQNQKRYVPG